MGMSKVYFVHLLIQLYFVSIIICQTDFTYHFCIDTYGNYTNTSAYKANLNTVLSSISSDTQTDSGYYNLSVGHDPNTVNAIALCRGDITAQECHRCLNDSANKLPQVCPTQKEAVGWYELCMLRYSNRSILGISDVQHVYFLNNVNNVSNVDEFNRVLGNLLGSLQSEAASGNSLLKFATGQANVGDYDRVYALAQCSPDLGVQSCTNCLGSLIRLLPNCCASKQGSRVTGPSCAIRYEMYLFYNLPSPPPPSPALFPPPPLPALFPPPSSSNSSISTGHGSNTAKIAIGIAVPIALIVAFTVGFLILCRKPRKRVEGSPSSHYQDEYEESKSLQSLQFGFDTIRLATDNFSDANKVGRGGFGTVYKGTLANRQEIAVKRLSTDSGQGDGEFKTEVLLVAKLQHRNLVKLLGFCLEEKERILIYEFVPNASLDHFLFDVSKRSYLNWETRYKIITGIARGLLYLHEDSRLRIVHRDLKASNILLDVDMNPKIADFGMARLFGADQTQENTSRVVGTYGYMAPEYVLHGFFSLKSDVYSFGVLVLEIITGRKNRGSQNGEYVVEDLLSFVWRNWREGTATHIVDPTLSTGSQTDIIRCIHMSLLCVQECVENRPTMSSVVLMLSSDSFSLPVPSHPAFVTHTASIVVHHNIDDARDKALENPSSNEHSITDLYPR